MKPLNAIKKDTSKPLYIQVAESITKYIQDNKLEDGEPLPSQNDLIKHFDVSQVTVRQALQRLNTEGLIIRVQGKGTFVSTPAFQERLVGVKSLEERLEAQGITVRNQYIESMKTTPAERIRRDLALSEGVQTFKIRRLKQVGDSVLAMETRHFPTDVALRFSFDDLKTIPFVSLLERFDDTRVKRISFFTRAATALDLEAEMMKIPLESPLLVQYGVYVNFKRTSCHGRTHQLHRRQD